MANVELTPDAIKQADRLPETILKRIRKVLDRLKSWPTVSGAKPLTGSLAGWYRIRTGDWRVRFRVEGDNIIVDKIGHRRDFYDA